MNSDPRGAVLTGESARRPFEILSFSLLLCRIAGDSFAAAFVRETAGADIFLYSQVQQATL